MSDHPWSQIEVLESLSKESLGDEIANEIAVLLMGGGEVYNGHRDYCGDGLFYKDNQFILASVYDGHPADYRIIWNNKTDFIEYISKASDYTCAGIYAISPELSDGEGNSFTVNNQRITKSRLIEYIESAESAWAHLNYCLITRTSASEETISKAFKRKDYFNEGIGLWAFRKSNIQLLDYIVDKGARVMEGDNEEAVLSSIANRLKNNELKQWLQIYLARAANKAMHTDAFGADDL